MRDVDRAAEVAQVELDRRAHVQDADALLLEPGEFLPLDHLCGAAQAVCGDITRHVDGILGRPVRRSVGQFQLLQIVDGEARLQRHGQGVDGAIHRVAADDLRTEEPAVLGPVQDADRLLGGAGVIGHVILGVRDAGHKGDAGALQAPGVGARRGHGEVKDLDDGGAQGPAVARLRVAGDVVRRDAGLAVGRPGQGHRAGRPGDGVHHLDGVADGIDVGVRGAQVLIGDHVPPGADLEPGLLGQPALRAHADGQDHHIHPLGAAVGGAHQEPAPERLLDGLQRGAQRQHHALFPEVVVHQGGHLIVQRGQHLVHHLHDGDPHAAMDEVLGHLQADKASAYHHGALHAALVHHTLDDVGVGDGAQRVDAGEVHARDRRDHGTRARGEDQLVVG